MSRTLLLFVLLSCVFNIKTIAQMKQESTYYSHPEKVSSQARMLNRIYKWIGIKKSAKRRLGKGNQMTRPKPIRKLKRKSHLRVDSIEGCKVYFISPKQSKKAKYMLYFHGGAYTEQFVKQHWLFMLHLMQETNYTIVAPDYPLAPQTTYKENLALMLKLYQQLGKEVGFENIVLMGDSAGGGLAVATALAAKEKHLPQPAKLILLSPWLNLKMDHPKIQELDKVDPMLNVDWLKAAALAYAGSAKALEDPLVSPLLGDLGALAPISLFIGGRDMLLADAEPFRTKVLAVEGKINYYFYPEMVHVWMLVGFLPEAKFCFNQILNEIKELD
jgi:acetyl esterase/lipase